MSVNEEQKLVSINWMRKKSDLFTKKKESSFGSIRREKGRKKHVESLSPISSHKSTRSASSSATSSPLIYGLIQRDKETTEMIPPTTFEIIETSKPINHDGSAALTVDFVVSSEPKPLEVILGEESTVEQVVDMLSSFNAMFVVIYEKHGNPLGVIHLLDIINLCCENIEKWSKPYEFVFHSKEQFSNMTAKELLEKTNCYRIDEEASLYELLSLFEIPKVDKVIVMTRNRKQNHQDVRTVLTRSDMVSWIYDNRKELGDLMEKTCGEKIFSLGVINEYSAGIQTKEFIEDAFLSLWRKQAGGILLSHGNCPVEKFLNLAVQIILAKMQEEKSNDITVCVFKEDTLEKLLQLCKNRQIQRVIIVDSTRKPIGELSISDILTTCCQCLET